MGWWKADPVPDEAQFTSTSIPTKKLPAPRDAPEAAPACPVDPQTREIWLQQAESSMQKPVLPPTHPPLPPAQRASTFAAIPSEECSSDRIDQRPITLTTRQPTTSPSRPLSHERVVSTIPRGTGTTTTPATPANSQNAAPKHSSGNWIYPSESQFFEAVMRKQSTTPEAIVESVSAIIPIHNAVNERAWSLIKTWEGNSSASCGGPKLLSFKGLGAGALSPKAKWMGLWGYTTPFDRHDWVVERCGGERVEYVIDFYQGKEEKEARPGQLNFYLDVRPKLNSFEGWRMRAERIVGYR